jgi:uncharacterized protein (TIRG00374 family)
VKRALNLILSLGITTVSFWWTFKDVRMGEMLDSLRFANYFWLLPYALILVAVHLLRTLRWGNLLSSLEVVPFPKLNEASAIGFMMLVILPFRLGEFARPFLIAQRSSIRRSSAMTSVVLERIVDGITIAVLLQVLILFVPGESADLARVRVGANLMLAVFGGGLLFLLFARWQHQRTVELIRATAGRISPAIADKVADVVDRFVGALRQLPDRKNLAMFFLATAIYWGINGLGMAVLARAFDCQGAPAGAVCEPMVLSWFQGYVVLCVLVVGLMIPAAPGSAGTFQAFVVLGLSLFLPKSVVNASGVAYANVLWLTQMAQQIGVGLIFMVASRQSFTDLAGKLNQGQAPSPNS